MGETTNKHGETTGTDLLTQNANNLSDLTNATTSAVSSSTIISGLGQSDTINVYDAPLNIQSSDAGEFYIPTATGWVSNSSHKLWYQFENDGSDATGNSSDVATITGSSISYDAGVTAIPGGFRSKGLKFSTEGATSTYFEATQVSNLSLPATFCYSFWIYLYQLPSDEKLLWCQSTNADTSKTCPACSIDSTGHIKFYKSKNVGGQDVITSATAITPLVYTHVILQFGDNFTTNIGMEVWINGTRDANSNASLTQQMPITTVTITIGSHQQGGTSTNGTAKCIISQFSAFNTTLSSSQIQTVMTQGQLTAPDVIGFSDVK